MTPQLFSTNRPTLPSTGGDSVTSQQAREWLIYSSLTACGTVFVFLFIAPVSGYPIEWRDALRVIELIIPVFLGYLGSAAHYVFGRSKQGHVLVGDQEALLQPMVKGPVILFAVICTAIVVSFGYSNRKDAIPGSGMSVDMLAGSFTAALGVLTVTTSVAVSHLFSLDVSPKAKNHAGGSDV